MTDVALTIVAWFVWVYVAFLVIVRLLERRSFKYSMAKTDTGFAFKYTLGVYAGRVTMIRDPLVTTPRFIVGVNGWECRFPDDFNLRDMCDYLQDYAQYIKPGTSHCKDVPIFNQVINLKNDALISISGKLYTFDDSDSRQLVV